MRATRGPDPDREITLLQQEMWDEGTENRWGFQSMGSPLQE